MAAETPHKRCERAGCQCNVTEEEMRKSEGGIFCSEGCARGEGCRHRACGCAG